MTLSGMKKYARGKSRSLVRKTDLSQKCISVILANLVGKKVLEVGAGAGYLAGLMAKTKKVTALDILTSPNVILSHPDVHFVSGNITAMPFADKEFDTVVCTHVLEHIPNLLGAISELRRVARKKLIVVVPKQRPYRYTFDSHVHYFPYPHSFLIFTGKTRFNRCQAYGNELVYLEKIQ